MRSPLFWHPSPCVETRWRDSRGGGKIVYHQPLCTTTTGGVIKGGRNHICGHEWFEGGRRRRSWRRRPSSEWRLWATPDTHLSIGILAVGRGREEGGGDERSGEGEVTKVLLSKLFLLLLLLLFMMMWCWCCCCYCCCCCCCYYYSCCFRFWLKRFYWWHIYSYTLYSTKWISGNEFPWNDTKVSVLRLFRCTFAFRPLAKKSNCAVLLPGDKLHFLQIVIEVIIIPNDPKLPQNTEKIVRSKMYCVASIFLVVFLVPVTI